MSNSLEQATARHSKPCKLKLHTYTNPDLMRWGGVVVLSHVVLALQAAPHSPHHAAAPPRRNIPASAHSIGLLTDDTDAADDAARSYHRGAEAGQAELQFRLATCYQRGRGGP